MIIVPTVPHYDLLHMTLPQGCFCFMRDFTQQENYWGKFCSSQLWKKSVNLDDYSPTVAIRDQRAENYTILAVIITGQSDKKYGKYKAKVA